MRSHEHYEEYKLYPYLEKRWNTSLSDAQKGHELLHRAHVEVLSAFQTLHDDEEGPARLTAALSFHEQILKEHLALEEERVIPLLLSLSPEEFRNYYNSSIHTLLSQLSESE